MKIPLLYGSLIALIGALLTFGLYFAGYHDTPAKLEISQWIGLVIGVSATVVGLALAMRERRAQAPADVDWSYGSAFGTGLLTALWATVIGAVIAYIYFALVNPGFGDVSMQMQIAKAEAAGAPASQIEAMQSGMKMFMKPAVITIFQAIGGFLISLVIALIVAIFFRQPKPVAAPPVV